MRAEPKIGFIPIFVVTLLCISVGSLLVFDSIAIEQQLRPEQFQGLIIVGALSIIVFCLARGMAQRWWAICLFCVVLGACATGAMRFIGLM